MITALQKTFFSFWKHVVLSAFCSFLMLNVKAQKTKVLRFWSEHTYQNISNSPTLLNEIGEAYCYYNLDSAIFFADRSYSISLAQNNKQTAVDALIVKAIGHSLDVNYGKSAEVYTQALNMAKQIKYTKGIGRCYSGLSFTLTMVPVDVREGYAIKADSILRPLKDWRWLATNQIYRGYCHLFGDHIKFARSCLKHAIVICIQNNDSVNFSLALNALGTSFIDEGLKDSVIFYFNRSIDINNMTGNLAGLSLDYSNLPIIYYKTSQLSEALKYTLVAEKISKQAQLKNFLIGTYNQIGLIYFELNNYPLSRQYYLNSLQIALSASNFRFATNSEGYLGTIYLNEENMDSAQYYFNRSFEHAKITNENFDIGSASLNLGDFYKAKKQFSNAYNNYIKAIEQFQSIEDKYNLSFCYSALSNLVTNARTSELASINLEQRQQFSKAKELAQKALQYSYEAASPLVTRDALLQLSTIAEKENNKSLAFSYFKQYANYKDSLTANQNSQSLNVLLIKYDTEKKEQQIALLTKDTQIQQTQINKSKNQRNGLLAGCSLALVLTGILYNRYRVKKKANEEIQNTMQNLSLTQNKIIENEKLAHMGTITSNVAIALNEPLSQLAQLNQTNGTLLQLLVTENNSNIEDQLKNNLKQVYSLGLSADKIVKNILTEAKQMEKQLKQNKG